MYVSVYASARDGPISAAKAHYREPATYRHIAAIIISITAGHRHNNMIFHYDVERRFRYSRCRCSGTRSACLQKGAEKGFFKAVWRGR